jgi:hypothetical protein
MSLYPKSFRRCQHVKVNGTQCGSPALREERYCFYHLRYHQKSKEVSADAEERTHELMPLPTLEDANSVQVTLAEVIRLVTMQEIDYRAAGLILYALQTASANMRMTSFEPAPTQVVIDRECVEQRPIGASAWSAVVGREYDDVSDKNAAAKSDEELACDLNLMYLLDRRLMIDPELMNKTVGELRANKKR